MNASDQRELDAAFSAIAQSHADAALMGADPFFFNQRQEITALAARYGIPAVYEQRPFAEAGGLISYGTSLTGIYRQAAGNVGRILEGARPADLPVQDPTRFELVINLKTAKELGLAVPPTILARADEVIELVVAARLQSGATKPDPDPRLSRHTATTAPSLGS